MAEPKSSSASAAAAPAPEQPAEPRAPTLTFSLVVTMLGILCVLAAALIIVPAFKLENSLLEYYKWSLSALLAAFGAWIGAGAAYFFGKQNLDESSRSTETALRIQQETLQGRTRKNRVKDLALTAINTNFLFTSAAKRKDVVAGLAEHADYWWVPVLDSSGKGALEDVVHARVFWTQAFADDDSVSKIVSDVDTQAQLTELKALHGGSFFAAVSLEDALEDVSATMNKTQAVVGIVVDDKRRPTYCFTKQDLASARR